jgi:hypothetical protein
VKEVRIQRNRARNKERGGRAQAPSGPRRADYLRCVVKCARRLLELPLPLRTPGESGPPTWRRARARACAVGAGAENTTCLRCPFKCGQEREPVVANAESEYGAQG